jgi:hypothetical protein
LTFVFQKKNKRVNLPPRRSPTPEHPQDVQPTQDVQLPQDLKPQNPDPQPDVPILSAGMPVNAISKGYPYLAGVVDSVSGVTVSVHFPYLKKNASRTFVILDKYINKIFYLLKYH